MLCGGVAACQGMVCVLFGGVTACQCMVCVLFVVWSATGVALHTTPPHKIQRRSFYRILM